MTDNSKREYPVDPLALSRESVCNKCKFLKTKEDTYQYCTLCGCLMKGMINEEKRTCPIGKW